MIDDIFRRNLHIVEMHGGGVGLAVIRVFTLQTWFSARSLACDHELTPHSKVNLATILALATSFSYPRKHDVSYYTHLRTKIWWLSRPRREYSN
jgi:hypothetical protein